MIAETIAFRESSLSGRLAFLNNGTAGPAVIEVYGGTRPATAADAPAAPALVTLELTNPAGSVSDGTLELTATGPALIMVSGTATWARVKSRAGATAFDMDAGAVGSGSECELSQSTLFAGGLVSLVSAVLG